MYLYFKYLKYLIKHKYYVFIAGFKIGAPLFRLIIHDWSKFLPSEFIPYANYFYGNNISKHNPLTKTFQNIYGIYYPPKWTTEYWSERFNEAWLFHQHRNKHHWQYWVLKNDSGSINVLKIPQKYMLELLADWAGAGKAIHGKWDVKGWYSVSKDRMLLHKDTRILAEELINKYF